jgi:hypothetical protein
MTPTQFWRLAPPHVSVYRFSHLWGMIIGGVKRRFVFLTPPTLRSLQPCPHFSETAIIIYPALCLVPFFASKSNLTRCLPLLSSHLLSTYCNPVSLCSWDSRPCASRPCTSLQIYWVHLSLILEMLVPWVLRIFTNAQLEGKKVRQSPYISSLLEQKWADVGGMACHLFCFYQEGNEVTLGSRWSSEEHSDLPPLNPPPQKLTKTTNKSTRKTTRIATFSKLKWSDKRRERRQEVSWVCKNVALYNICSVVLFRTSNFV